ncbi:flagellar hook-basal body complex protein [Ureibacillus thermophilus]|uniref:Flagellar hook protein FlgE n=1 Tax=Ureibacillus thermophilus TaxID=367743 RepID=A0A4P6UQU3_9BACL|nr:flagellar hook-basal body complex protein [Ureibacillus thermophilus]QBK25639.1 flagellar hook-basal body complex protein [Ureibacillus thermophilus]
MLRSMYSAISGVRNHQTKLDVIGNNISNVNTHGFKKSRTIFKEMVSQNIGSASAATATRGGVNPKQVGLGSTMAAIDTIHSTGSLQSTARTLDLAISGDGYFMVADKATGTGVGGSSFASVLYTRAGNFYMDKDGYLVNAEGKYLVGVAPEKVNSTTASTDTAYPLAKDVKMKNDSSDLSPQNPTTWASPIDSGATTVYAPIRIPTDATEMSIGQDGTVTFVDANGELRWAGQIVLAKFPNPGGLQKSGSNYYTETSNSGSPYTQVGTVAGIGSVESGFLEMSNVDLSEEFTEMIVAQRGFQANTRIITTSDQILEELVNLKR